MWVLCYLFFSEEKRFEQTICKFKTNFFIYHFGFGLRQYMSKKNINL